MQATIGDHIIIHSHHVGEIDRSGEVLAVRGSNGEPPYEVRWDFDGHEGLFFPGVDAMVVHPPLRSL